MEEEQQTWYYIIYDTYEEALSRSTQYPFVLTVDDKYALDVTEMTDLTEAELASRVTEITPNLTHHNIV